MAYLVVRHGVRHGGSVNLLQFNWSSEVVEVEDWTEAVKMPTQQDGEGWG